MHMSQQVVIWPLLSVILPIMHTPVHCHWLYNYKHTSQIVAPI